MTTLRYTCSKPDCTIGTTGKCLELHEPAECPHVQAASAAIVAEPPTTPRRDAARVFPSANELGLRDACAAMQGKYAHLIAILGATDAGKTCMLTSLYLLASHAGLAPRFQFAGSLTLNGFELRARRLRKWQGGNLPDQLADHTTHSDPRNPGLLHLALSDNVASRRIELLLTDLPGEWTTGLVKQARRAERFEFLQRADGVVIAVDSKKLRDSGQRHAELLNLEHLVDRLADAVDLDRRIPIFFVACKADWSGVDVPLGLERIVAHATSKGFAAQAFVVASFSHNPAVVSNGHGLQSLIEAIVDYQPSTMSRRTVQAEPNRSFGRCPGTPNRE